MNEEPEEIRFYLNDQRDIMRKKTEEFYPRLIQKGYFWEKNVPSWDLDYQIKSLQEKGLDIIVGTIAFDKFGRKNPEGRALFIKKQKKKK